MNHPDKFSAVFAVNAAWDEFEIVGIFSKDEEAQAFKAELLEDKAWLAASIQRLSMDVIKRQLVRDQLRDLEKVLKPLLSPMPYEIRGEAGEDIKVGEIVSLRDGKAHPWPHVPRDEPVQ